MAEYIDKQKFIDELDDKYSLGEIGRMERDIIVNALLYANLADVRPEVRGHWEAMEPALFGLSYVTCSACGRRLVLLDEIGMNFCPHCGAKMKGTYDTKEDQS